MPHVTQVLSEHDFEDNIIATYWRSRCLYILVDDACKEIVAELGRLRQAGPEPAFSDSEVITVSLVKSCRKTRCPPRGSFAEVG